MEPKLTQIKRLWDAGDGLGALRLAARFPQLGVHKEAITRAWAAHCHPDTYRDMGCDPAALVADGLAAIRERYGLGELAHA